jgi:methyl-accepting chemotaxis protein
MEMLANGDFSFDVHEVENDSFVEQLLRIREALQLLEIEVAESPEGKQDDPIISTQTEKEQNGFKRILKRHRQLLKKEKDQRDFYASILDAIPYSILVSDQNYKYRYVNKNMSDYLIAKGIIKNSASALGMDCSVSGSNMCGNENCARNLLIKNDIHTTNFEARGKYYKEDIAFLKDKNDEDTEFVLEMTLDQTPIMTVDAYNRKEVERLKKNLISLSKGELNLDLELEKPDQFTHGIYDQFFSIRESILKVKNTIDHAVDRTGWITEEIIKGNLKTKIDENAFDGVWKNLIQGMNKLLEEISRPLYEVISVMEDVSNGSLEAAVVGHYQGDFEQLKCSVNQTILVLNGIIEQIKKATGEISRGNLRFTVKKQFAGDFSSISDSLRSILEMLNNLFIEVKQSTEQVAVGSGQVANGSQLLAQGAVEQAAAIEKLSTLIAEMTSQTQTNADNASKAQIRSDLVKNGAETGTAQMKAMQSSMDEINQASIEISKIIKVIDSIAFQTNILALNAAVEAARAGQHGKGFAVVAEEVRTLAARSAEAARETTALIESTIDKVKNGTSIADQTADALMDMVAGVTEVTELVNKIAKDSNEQATGIMSIRQGIDKVDEVIHQNSATAEESAAASEELSGQADLLKNRLNYFQLCGID